MDKLNIVCLRALQRLSPEQQAEQLKSIVDQIAVATPKVLASFEMHLLFYNGKRKDELIDAICIRWYALQPKREKQPSQSRFGKFLRLMGLTRKSEYRPKYLKIFQHQFLQHQSKLQKQQQQIQKDQHQKTHKPYDQTAGKWQQNQEKQPLLQQANTGKQDHNKRKQS